MVSRAAADSWLGPQWRNSSAHGGLLRRVVVKRHYLDKTAEIAPIKDDKITIAESIIITASADAVMDHLIKLQGRMGIYLFGTTLNSNRAAVFRLWRYLFDFGFFGCRIETDISSRNQKGFLHLMALAERDLIAPERWNEMQIYLWEINPAYRDFLIMEGNKAR